MKKRIFKNMCILAGGICLLAYTIIFLVFNFVFTGQTERYIRNQAFYLSNVLNQIDEEKRISCLESMKDESPARVTWIDQNGTVLFDTMEQATQMENHRSRPEVMDALEYGASAQVRHSTTLEEESYYYAVLLDDGTVLRLSASTKSVYALYISYLPVLAVILAVMFALITFFAHRMTDKIVQPINNLDLIKPEGSCPYEELKPLLSRIKRQNEERQKNEKMRQEFSANVSHELKTPLTSISGYAELMENGMVRPEDIPVFAGKIYKEAGRLIELVNDIIKISKLDERKIGIEKETVDLKQIALDVSEHLENVLQKYKVTMNVAGGHVLTQAVPRMMDELFYNLCENAIKYNRPGGQVYVTLTSAEDGHALITIEDTGIGIPEEHQERVFEKFYRVDKSHSKQSGGTGLGLAIVKHVVEYHDGQIQLESHEGKGTKITVTL